MSRPSCCCPYSHWPPLGAVLHSLWSDEAGLTTVEYALILAILGLACATVAILVAAKSEASEQAERRWRRQD